MHRDAKAVAIVGMPRSGTSSVAGAIAKLGVYFGTPSQLYGPDVSNQQGYWEHKSINAIHRSFHHSLNLTALDADPLPENWKSRPMTDEFIQRMVDTLEREFHSHLNWGWKDPQASCLLPFTYEVMTRLGIPFSAVICVRNPIDVAKSQFKRQNTPEAQTIGAWLLSTLSALRDCRHLHRTVIVYDQFLVSPEPSLRAVASQFSYQPTAVQWQESLESVRPELRNQQNDAVNYHAYPPIVERVYELCHAASANPDSLNRGEFDAEIDALWCEWKTLHDLFFRPSVAEATLGVSWVFQQKRQVVEQKYRMNKDWQTLHITVDSPANSRVSVLLYPLPAVVWIRHANWIRNGARFPAKLLPGRNGQLDEYRDLKRVWLFHGFEHVAIETPAQAGHYELELDLLVEANNLITGMTVQELSNRVRS